MSDKSELVKLIKKYAEIPHRSKGARPSAAVSGGQVAGQVGQVPSRQVASRPGAVRVGGSIPTVVKMQDELINLANTVVKAGGLFNVTPQQEKQVDSSPVNQEQAASRTSFLDFVARLARQSDVPAVEFNPAPGAVKQRDKGGAPATRMNMLMDTMRRIGGTQNTASELKTDGRWGPKTNAGVRNAYALAFALMTISEELGYKPKAYSMQYLPTFKSWIPEDPSTLSDPDKEKAASEITAHLQAIEKLFQEVKEHVLQNPGYQKYIDGNAAFATYKPKEAEVLPRLTPQQLQYSEQLFPQGFNIATSQDGKNQATFWPADLISADALKARIAKIEQGSAPSGLKINLDPYNVLTQISRKISGAIT